MFLVFQIRIFTFFAQFFSQTIRPFLMKTRNIFWNLNAAKNMKLMRAQSVIIFLPTKNESRVNLVIDDGSQIRSRDREILIILSIMELGYLRNG